MHQRKGVALVSVLTKCRWRLKPQTRENSGIRSDLPLYRPTSLSLWSRSTLRSTKTSELYTKRLNPEQHSNKDTAVRDTDAVSVRRLWNPKAAKMRMKMMVPRKFQLEVRPPVFPLEVRPPVFPLEVRPPWFRSQCQRIPTK